MLPTSLFILPDGHTDRCPSQRKLILSYWVGSLDRPPTDVHACDSIRICFETASYAAEVSPVFPILAGDMSASWACLACVFGWNLNYRYSELRGFVGECVAEEPVGYAIRLSSALAAHLAFLSPELVETLDSNRRIVLASETGQLFSEQPSLCSDIVSLRAAEPLQLQSCSASMSVTVSILLEFGSTVLEADLSQRDVSSKIELLQNPAFSTHHGNSNAVAVLVDPENILGCVWSRGLLLKHNEKTVAAGHQDARDSPTVCLMFLYSAVGSILTYGQPEPVMVSSDAEDGVTSACRFETEKPFVEPHRWMVDVAAYPAPLPSVALRFLNQLTGYACSPVLLIDEMMENRIGSRGCGVNGLETFGGNCLESYACFVEFPLLSTGQRQNVELKRLLRRCLPGRKMLPQLFNSESGVKVFRNSSPCLKAGISLR